MSESFLRLARKWTECAAAAALRDIGAVSRKMHRAACMRMNQCFLKPDVNTAVEAVWLPRMWKSTGACWCASCRTSASTLTL